MTEYRPMHTRALIRHAVVRVLKENPVAAASLKGRVFPNRAEHWLADELPAAGVYTLSEDALDSDVSPDPNERRIDLVIELLARNTAKVDDVLDDLTLVVEKVLNLDAIGEAMGLIVNERLIKAGLSPIEKNEQGRWPVDTLLLLGLKSTDIGLAVDGNRQIGVAVMNFDLEYEQPRLPVPWLPDFLLGVSGWDVEPSDGVIDMVSRVELEPAGAAEQKSGGFPDDALNQINLALKE